MSTIPHTWRNIASHVASCVAGRVPSCVAGRVPSWAASSVEGSHDAHSICAACDVMDPHAPCPARGKNCGECCRSIRPAISGPRITTVVGEQRAEEPLARGTEKHRTTEGLQRVEPGEQRPVVQPLLGETETGVDDDAVDVQSLRGQPSQP
jgi:hypothetical protein